VMWVSWINMKIIIIIIIIIKYYDKSIYVEDSLGIRTTLMT
jgi:hypothetical protein